MPLKAARAIPYWQPWSVLSCGLLLSAALGVMQHARVQREARAIFSRHADSLATQIGIRLRQPQHGLQGAAGMYAAVGDVTRAQFRDYVQACHLSAEYPGVRGLGFIERVPPDRLSAFVAAQRAAGEPGHSPQISATTPTGDLLVGKYLEPADDYPEGLGRETETDPRRRAAAEHALLSGETVLTEPLQLQPNQPASLGFVLVKPVYRQGTEPDTPQARLQTLQGLLYAPIVIAEVLRPVRHGTDPAAQFAHFALHDGPPAGRDAAAIFDSEAGRPAAAAPPRYTASIALAGAGRPLTLQVRSTPRFEAQSGDFSAWAVAAGGASATLLLAGLLALQLQRRYRAEQRALKATADLDRLALVAQRTINAVVITDVQRRIVWVNAAFERLTGYSSAEAMGRTPASLLQFEGTSAATVAQMKADLDAGRSFTGEVLNRAKDGREYWLELDIQPMRDGNDVITGFMAVETDITPLRQAEARARRSASLLRSAIDAMDDAFVLFDAADRLVLCNEKYRLASPAGGPDIVPGTRFEDIARAQAESGEHPAAIGRVQAWLDERMATHRAAQGTVIHQLSDGRVMRTVERRMPDGSQLGYRIDITDLVRAKELAEQTQRLQARFIATISHELRTPLQSITGFSDLGRVFAQPQPQLQAMFEDIHAGGMRMLKLVNEVLDLSKIDDSVGVMDLRRHDVAALAGEVAVELSGLAGQRGLRIALPGPLPCLLAQADGFRVQQVVRNVLANAIRFSPLNGAVELGFADRGEGGVEISVRDHGPGIPADELESIFDAFVQSSSSGSSAGGTGLGLAIARKIMATHGGSIVAENAADGGACIRIRFPAAPVAAVLPVDGETHRQEVAPAV